MNRSEKSHRVATVFVALVIVCSLLSFAAVVYADNTAASANREQPNISSSAPQATADSSASAQATPTASATPAATAAPMESSGESTVIADEDAPLASQHELMEWSLINLLATMVAVIVAVALVIASMIRDQTEGQGASSFGLVLISMAAAVFSLLLFMTTQNVGTRMVAIDEFTIAHVIMLAAVFLCAALIRSRDEEGSESKAE